MFMYYCCMFLKWIISSVQEVLLRVRCHLCIVPAVVANMQVHGRAVDICLFASCHDIYLCFIYD